MEIQQAIEHARKVAEEKYTEGMLCHANPNDNELDGCIECAKEHEQLAHWLEELQAYNSICTIEECRNAREKQTPKKPVLCMNEKSGMFVDYADGHGEYKTQMNNWWRCPFCNEVVGQRVIAHKHIHDQRKKNFCEKCGQAIDWSK